MSQEGKEGPGHASPAAVGSAQPGVLGGISHPDVPCQLCCAPPKEGVTPGAGREGRKVPAGSEGRKVPAGRWHRLVSEDAAAALGGRAAKFWQQTSMKRGAKGMFPPPSLLLPRDQGRIPSEESPG